MRQGDLQVHRLSPQQRYLWALQKATPGLPVDALCAILLEGQLDRAALRTALAKTIARHEILRTTFSLDPARAEPLQIVADECAPHIDEYDLRQQGAAEQEA